jgi:hypothetical protein
MNEAIQFITKINHGTITIPLEYSGTIQQDLEVEVIIKPKQSRLMDRLAQKPLLAKGWRDLTKEQIHARQDE